MITTEILEERGQLLLKAKFIVRIWEKLTVLGWEINENQGIEKPRQGTGKFIYLSL